MNPEELERLIAAGEGQHLEFKRGLPSTKQLCELAVCFANAEGGVLLLGVEDDGNLRGVTSYDPDAIRTGIFRGTIPPIIVEVEIVEHPLGTVLALRVPKAAAEVHGTTAGLYRWRVGKECLPMAPDDIIRRRVALGSLDISGRPAPGLDAQRDLDPLALTALREELSTDRPQLARLPTTELLVALDMTAPPGASLSVAALLLLGREEALRRHLPQAEWILRVELRSGQQEPPVHLRGPLVLVLKELASRIERYNRARLVTTGLVGRQVHDFPPLAVREALLNAASHRDYARPAAVHVELREGRSLSVSSPGPFPSGVNPQNVLRQQVPRNRQLAGVFGALRWVERAGLGMDRMVEHCLAAGKRAPEIGSDAEQVTVKLLDGGFDESFIGLVERLRADGREIDLDRLIVLALLRRQQEAAQGAISRAIQRAERETGRILARAVADGLLVRTGVADAPRFSLGEEARRILATPPPPRLGPGEGIEERTLALVRRLGEVSNADLRRELGLSEVQARRVLARMVAQGQVLRVGERRWTRYRAVD